jgi:hypothetical protein
LDHIRVRGYDSKKAEKRFLKAIHPSVCPSATHPSVRPPSIRPSVSAFYPNPEKMLDARKNFRREKKFQTREKKLDARKNFRREKKFQTREKMLDAGKKSRNMKFKRNISMALIRLRRILMPFDHHIAMKFL